MDEMFLNFYPKDVDLLVPTGTKRVGTNRKEDEKNGCTVAVSCEMFTSSMLPPFIVMDGKRDGYLAKRYEDWDGQAKVAFQQKHWMDQATAMDYLDWLSDLFEGERIGLIWDLAAAHKAEEVMQYAEEIGIVLSFIPAGLTSILQVCDLIINKALKAAFKRRYCEFKIKNDPGPGGKYIVARENVLEWIETATREIDSAQTSTSGIAAAFKKYGQDPRAKNADELQENRIYASLLENQTAVDLSD
ncbi:hypothetical protein ACHHYP_11851 [Achlya hypogyna]|uniref:DDE-1 domain-containing protein n=1 Tax=Achlya hypogyna TaxID=1202772 RepID=A0A1V9YI86_ACHHY|nr:hypothetical protein ACHHYP_11851 [Achlya hypogyna]